MIGGSPERGSDDAPFGVAREDVSPAPWSGTEVVVTPWPPPEMLRASSEPPPAPELPPAPTSDAQAGAQGAPQAEALVEAPPDEITEPTTPPEVPAEPEIEPEPVEPRERDDCPKCEALREDHEAALTALREELERPMARAAAALEHTASELSDGFSGVVVDLALRLAERILERSAELDRDLLVRTVDEAVRLAGPLHEMTLRAHPDDVQRLREYVPDMASSLSGRPVQVVVQPSEDVELGTCIVLFDEGIVDARWSEQLERLRDAVSRALIADPEEAP